MALAKGLFIPRRHAVAEAKSGTVTDPWLAYFQQSAAALIQPIDLAVLADFLNQLPIAHGGTGAATAAAGFDALAPTTVDGDLIIRSGGTNVRQPIGGDHTFLRALGGFPFWNAVDLTSADVSGVLPVANGGVDLGAFTTPAFSAGDYTASTGNWTLTAPDVTTWAYHRVGRRLRLLFSWITTTVSATPTTLSVALPAGLVAASRAVALCDINENGTYGIGVASVNASGTVLNIIRQDRATFATATNTTAIEGQIEIETTT